MVISSTFILMIAEATNTAVCITFIPAQSRGRYLVIVGSVLIFIAFIYALQKLPPEISSIYAYINPLWASLKTTEQPKDNSDIYSFK